jgi:hypothetical protein
MRKLVVFLTVAALALGVQQSIQAEDYQDRYREAIATYRNSTPQKYDRIYHDGWMDASSRVTWVDAARDYCENNGHTFIGPSNDVSPFDCTDYPANYR